MLKLRTLHPDSRASRYFDALRWFSAFYVMIYHLRPVLFAGYQQLPHKSVFIKAFYAATSMGYEFVMLFFVLSGYLISGTVIRSVQKGGWSWKTYLLNRMTRLWIVLIPALLLTYLWAQIQGAFFFYSGDLRWTTLLGNLFFLQGIYVANYGDNLPLWSLSYEFWYYILFPCLLLLFASRRLVYKLLYGALSIGIALIVGKTILMYFAVWLLGALLAVAPAIRLPHALLVRGALPLTAAAAGAALLASKVLSGDEAGQLETRFPSSFAVGLCFTALLYVILLAWNRPEPLDPGKRRPAVHAAMAGFSYTVYLTHYPLVGLIRVWLGDGKWGVWAPDLLHMALATLIAIAIMAYAWVVSRLTEANTGAVRQWVADRLPSSRRKSFGAQPEMIQKS